MTSLRESLRRFFAPPDPLKPGIYHYQSPAEDPLNYRYHLRLEPDGNGLLIINASTVLHLNQSAAEYAYHLVKDTPPDEAGSTVAGRYRISASKAITDYVAFKEGVQVWVNQTKETKKPYLSIHIPLLGIRVNAFQPGDKKEEKKLEELPPLDPVKGSSEI